VRTVQIGFRAYSPGALGEIPHAKEHALRTTRTLIVGALAATCLAIVPTTAFASSAPPAGAHQDTLRALAAKNGIKFGVAVNMDALANDAKYNQLVGSQFSSVTPENVMKWDTIEPQQGVYNFAPGDTLVAFAKAHDQVVRGHNLVWHNQLPSWLTSGTFTAAQLRDILRQHILAEAGHFKGQIQQWDVVNEAFNDDGTPRQDLWYNAYQQLTGDGLGYIADAFRWAHQADPNAQLFYNDYNLEFTGAKSNAVYSFVQQLQAQGVPINGVGFQGHLDTQYGYPDLQNNLQRFADLHLKVAMTEVDVRTFVAKNADGTYSDTPANPADAQKQIDYWTNTLQACLAVKACKSFTTWGLSDNYSWIPGVFPGEGAGLLYDTQENPKPQYYAVQDVLRAGAQHHHH
jgi:endo-1,4-beta-xylanase